MTISYDEPMGHVSAVVLDDNSKHHHDHDHHHGHHYHADGCPTYENLQYVPKLFRFGPNAPIEASGLAVDIYTRAIVGMCSLFLGPALLELASNAAGCPTTTATSSSSTNNDDDDDCDLKVYGFRPSSLLTNMAVIAGLLGSLTLPVFGSIVDHTHYRRQVGAYTAAGLALIKAIEIGVGPNTWFFITILQIASSFFFNFHITASYAYISDLSSDSTQQSEYNTSFAKIMYISTLLFMIQVIGLSSYLGTDDVGTARISQTITTITCTPLFYLAWRFLFRDRPALSQVPEGMNLITCGFQKVYRTCQTIRSDLPALKYVLGAVAFGEAGSGALVTVATTYMKNFLRMDANEIGIVFLVVVLSGIPGCMVGNWFTNQFRSPIKSVMLCDFFFICSTGLSAVVLTGPQHKDKTIIFGILWGISLGWLSPQHTTSIVPIIPRGQEAELMGMYLLSGQILAWMPPTVFTVLNEMGFPMSYGLASLNVFFLFGIICMACVADYEGATNLVQIPNSAVYELTQTDLL